MRLNHALFVLLFTIPLTAQEEPLPVVTARNAAPEVMLIATAVEPIRDFRGPTLAEAARANDFISFDALYREAGQRGESVAAYETLHELWVYSVTDPIGAFYGTDMYEKLARAYPGYAQFIEDYSIVDSHGNVFYPTAETREFVLARAIEGRAPRVLVASDGVGPPKPAPVVADRSDRVVDAPVVATRQRAGGRGAHRSTSAATVAAITQEKTRVTAAAPVTAKAVPAPVVVAEVAAAPVVAEAAPVIEDVPQPVVPAQPVAARTGIVETVQQPAAAADASPASRGILLIVIGLVGIGLLAVMFRAPKETLPAPVVRQPVARVDEKPVAQVEPLKRPEGPQRASGKNRASGSRG
ncbi:MAG: hypothetical protein QOJ98_1693 [Acidobacteriota bacterium]|nr:hypothetical protein [Acidobacteriota bacterium]